MPKKEKGWVVIIKQGKGRGGMSSYLFPTKQQAMGFHNDALKKGMAQCASFPFRYKDKDWSCKK